MMTLKKTPSKEQFETTKWLCTVLHGSGHKVQLAFKGDLETKWPAIKVRYHGKLYHLSDPDWNVVNKQLLQLINTLASR